MLVFGGSLGARSINLAAVEAFADAGYHVLHVPGARDFAELRPRPASATTCANTSRPFGQALAAADLAVARAGGSVFELAQYGLPAILIPYPHASADHQTANARWMADAGAATILAGRRAHARAAAQRGRRVCSATRSGWPRWPPRRAAWRAPTPPPGGREVRAAAPEVSGHRHGQAAPVRPSPSAIDLLASRGVRCKPHSTLSNRNQSHHPEEEEVEPKLLPWPAGAGRDARHRAAGARRTRLGRGDARARRRQHARHHRLGPARHLVRVRPHHHRARVCARQGLGLSHQPGRDVRARGHQALPVARGPDLLGRAGLGRRARRARHLGDLHPDRRSTSAWGRPRSTRTPRRGARRSSPRASARSC